MLSQPYRTILGNVESSMPLHAALIVGVLISALQP